MAETKAKPSRKTPTDEPTTTPQNPTEGQEAADPAVAEERQRMIAEAAYHKAEQREFAPGRETEDWLEAEREVTGAQASQ